MTFDALSCLFGILSAAAAIGLPFYFYAVRRQRHIQELLESSEHFRTLAQQFSLEKVEALTRAERLPELEGKLAETFKELQKSEQEKQSMRSLLEREKQAIAEQKELLSQAEQKLSDAFKAISADALDRNNKAFLNLAQQTFINLQDKTQQDLASRERAISNLVTPVKETLAGVQSKLHELEKTRESAYHVLKMQVSDLIAGQKELRSETANLVKALRAPSVRGRWGEMQLKRVVETAGLSSHCDFIEQASITSDDKLLRPDMIVKLPGGKGIVVDAKTPLAAYLDALEATDDITRKERLQSHASQVRSHILALSSKSYWDQFPSSSTPEFVVMFLPGETFFSAALEQDPSLIELGVEKKVIITTPSTLIALLHAVAYGWRQETLAKNTQEISDLGRELYKRLADMGHHFSKLGRDLGQAVKSYNNTLGTLERRVLPSARKFKELETTSSRDEIDNLQQLEYVPRDLQAPELVVN